MLLPRCGSAVRAGARSAAHGLDMPPYEELLVCPCCGKPVSSRLTRCDLCGEWITGKYVETLDGDRICGECYTRHDAGDY